MIAFDFEYYRPANIEEACKLHKELTDLGKYPVYYAGGTEIISYSRAGKLRFQAVIDLKDIPQCRTLTDIMDGWPVKACQILAVETVGHKLITIEGLRNTPIQQAFIDKFALQCGFCTPGFIINCHALINIHPDADDQMINEWLGSNLCRCTSYSEIKEAVTSVLSK